MLKAIYMPRGRAREYASLALNLYNGCAHGCRYCYARGIMRRTYEDFTTNVAPRDDIIRKLHRDCELLEKDADHTPPILLCFTTDPYQPIERDAELTREAIQTIKGHGLRFQVLTKSGVLCRRDFPLYRSGDLFAVTLTHLSAEQQRLVEPGADSPIQRIKALRIAHEHGIQTWASLEPVLDPATALELIRLTRGFVDEYRIGTFNQGRHPVSTIDWQQFARDAIALLLQLNKPFYIKRDLQNYLPTDERIELSHIMRAIRHKRQERRERKRP